MTPHYRHIILSLLFCFFVIANSQNYISKSWVSDLGNGKYKNPVLNADYSDPDVCRVGDDFYMTASSFNCVPGLPILHSKDLVNWKLIGYAIQKLEPKENFMAMQHGNGVWAPSIRFHRGEFYIYWGDPDYGIYMVKTKDPAGKWSDATLVKAGKGLIDPCPLWDDDGRVYLAHAYAGSRAGIKSILAVSELNADGTQAITPSRTVYDGHELDPTIEGAKFYKRNGEYYIFAPAGGVATGWQVALKSKNVYGAYERKIVLEQGKSSVNGPHQGAWVDTPAGEDWFLHFQDKGAQGRVVHLQPMTWSENGFPVIGVDKDKNGIGEPVLEYKKPKLSTTVLIETPVESDEFSSGELGLQWQWHANPMDWWSFNDSQKSTLTLFSVPIPENYRNLWDVPNLLLQKFPADTFTSTVKLNFKPDSRFVGERAGLVVMGMDYALLTIEKANEGLIVRQNECLDADKGRPEKENASITASQSQVYFRVYVDKGICTFYYSFDGKDFTKIGKTFKAREGKWIGAKMGVFCSRPMMSNDGGCVEIDWFRVE